MYGAMALFFLLVGGLEALIIRAQLIVPENDLVSAERYNQLFTMHGTTMIFLAVMPLNAAFFNFLVPLQIGARDVAFPRINSFSLWAFVAGALVLNFSWLMQAFGELGWFTASGPTAGMTDFVPGMGWFGYAPLTERQFTGVGTDFWIMGLQILGIASLSASMNFIATIINMRAPGMKMMRLPVFTWMTLIVSLLIVFAFPAITIALGQLMFDRVFDTSFFQVARRRPADPVAALVLDFRPPGSLHPRAPSNGHRLRGAAHFLEEAIIWLLDRGILWRSDWLPRIRCLVTPHVHHWFGQSCNSSLLAADDGHRRANRC